MRKKRYITGIVTAVLVVAVFFAQGTCLALTIKDSMKLYDEGKREYKREKYDEAIESFKKAVEECPESAMTEVAMYYLGKSYEKAGQKTEAKTVLKGLIEKYGSGKWAVWANNDIKAMD
ncbi:MAG: tetratricopeptide repeat protein [Candidatus Omnitrophica bacterium]|nr:tetratricopeptide repeat protein [Candidatus Omnitrophota bacterium]MDD5487872.1 tetratricopeptide repeat protein [Candidatus Omnitrophota bacterium]